MTAFFRIHSGLDREGPGDRASLDRALAGIAPDARICDAGCGPGADVEALLTHVPQGHVHAVDLHPPFVEAVRTRFARDPRVTAEGADFTALTGPYDVIWSAGAVYSTGIPATLAAWRKALAPGGCAAFSHLCWTGAARPPPAAAFWAEEFAAMGDIAQAEAEIAAAGWRLLDRWPLGPAGWEAYYAPLEARLDALGPTADPELAQAIAAHRAEIATWRAHGHSYDYFLFRVAP